MDCVTKSPPRLGLKCPPVEYTFVRQTFCKKCNHPADNDFSFILEFPRLCLGEIDPPFGTRIYLRDHVACNMLGPYLREPFDSRFKQTVAEVFLQYIVGSVIQSVLYHGQELQAWRELWHTYHTEIECISFFDNRTANVVWCDDLSISARDLQQLIDRVSTCGTFVCRFDWNRYDLCLPLVTHLLDHFERVEMYLSTQSAFPIPHSFIVATYPQISPEKTCGIKTCVKEKFLYFLRDVYYRIYSNENLLQWMFERKKQSLFVTRNSDFLDWKEHQEILLTRMFAPPVPPPPVSENPTSPSYQMWNSSL